MKNKVLIAVDLSESTEAVINKGIELAIKMDATVILSSVVTMYVDYLQAQMALIPSPWDEIYTAQKEAAIKELGLVQKKYPNVPIEIFVEVGNPKDVVIEKAIMDKVDYIVVGTHGRTGFSHVVMGSTAEYIVRHATMPVMVVPMK
ncbi:MAG: universal stress protein [Bacteroidetes bacterium]|jgi:nucleotide-binding universal stress UspA family protein|nr:universal stress protein [Bacteroidota bacterium]